jgi:hypothetical protein
MTLRILAGLDGKYISVEGALPGLDPVYGEIAVSANIGGANGGFEEHTMKVGFWPHIDDSDFSRYRR